jgi:hypothetical protein
MMLNAKVGEVPVVTREKLLVGTINIEAMHRRKDGENAWHLRNHAPESATIGCSIRYSTTGNQQISQTLRAS